MLLMQRRGGQPTGTGEVHAPMPGLIVDITVENGAAVKQGDTLIILESIEDAE